MSYCNSNSSSENGESNINNKNNSNVNQKFMKFQPKIILLGNSTVGKTSILERYTNGQFNPYNTLTIGIDFRVTEHIVGENKHMKLKIWDTSGQERFRAIAKNFYSGSHGVCLVFDVNSEETFEQINFWVNKISENSEQKNIIKCLVGNKIDLVQNVKEEAIIDLCDQNSLKYFRTSAKDGTGIDQVFDYIAEQCYQNFGIEAEKQEQKIQQAKQDQQQQSQKQKLGSKKNGKKTNHSSCC